MALKIYGLKFKTIYSKLYLVVDVNTAVSLFKRKTVYKNLRRIFAQQLATILNDFNINNKVLDPKQKRN